MMRFRADYLDELRRSQVVTRVKMLKLKEVVELTGLSRAMIYRYEGRGKFPARRQMGPNSVRWNSEEVVE